MLSTSTSSSRKTSSIKSVEFSLYLTASFIASRKAWGKMSENPKSIWEKQRTFCTQGHSSPVTRWVRSKRQAERTSTVYVGGSFQVAVGIIYCKFNFWIDQQTLTKILLVCYRITKNFNALLMLLLILCCSPVHSGLKKQTPFPSLIPSPTPPTTTSTTKTCILKQRIKINQRDNQISPLLTLTTFVPSDADTK